MKEEKTYSDGFISVYRASFQDDGIVYKRSKVTKKDAVSVLLYDKNDDTVILVKQYRYPMHKFVNNGYLLEIVAGTLDESNKIRETAVKEVEEEVGYKLKENELIPLSVCYTSPGYSTEKIFQFAAIVNNKKKINGGGGVKKEHENIQVVKMPLLQFSAFCENGSIIDAKTKLSYFESKANGVFTRANKSQNSIKKRTTSGFGKQLKLNI